MRLPQFAKKGDVVPGILRGGEEIPGHDDHRGVVTVVEQLDEFAYASLWARRVGSEVEITDDVDALSVRNGQRLAFERSHVVQSRRVSHQRQ